jgi:hypothetical protein
MPSVLTNAKLTAFIKNTTILSLGATAFPKTMLGKVSEKIRIGFTITGARGKWLLDQFLLRPDIEVPAICAIDK